MQHTWPQSTKLNLLTEALLRGTMTAELTSPREAELFRFALYRFINTPNDLRDKFKGKFSITLNGKYVTITKLPEIRIIPS